MAATSWKFRAPGRVDAEPPTVEDFEQHFGYMVGGEGGDEAPSTGFERSSAQAKSGEYSAYSPGGEYLASSAYYTVPDSSSFEFESWVFVPDPANTDGSHFNSPNAPGNDWAGPHTTLRNGGEVGYYNDADSWTMTGYTIPASTWVRFRTVVDVPAQRFDLYALEDGGSEQQIVDAGKFIDRDASFQAGDRRVYRWSSNGGTDMYIDDVSIPLGVDDRLLDVPDCTLAYNRFARSAEVELDDPDGVIPDEYPRPTPVVLDVKRDIDDEYSRRFGGYVNNPKSEQNTATLELLSHDAWIRSRDVYRSYSSTAISTILEDLITDLTPLTWDASRVNVYDDATVDVSWSGTPLDKVVEELASYSNDEIFGGTDDRVFFFEQRDSNRAPRDFTAGEYFADSVEFEQDGSAELNEVTVYYGGNPASDAVVVDDAAAKKALADELGADRPVVISTSKTFTEITTEEAARRKGREILSGASAIQTGELTTWEAFEVDPGDVTRVQVPEQSIDGEFRVAEISHSWGDDETTLKLAENEQGVVDALVELSDEVSRVEARAADNNATITRFTTFDLPFLVEFDVQAYKRVVPADQLLFGPAKGGWGDTRTGGGRWGDQRGDREQLL